MSKFCVGCNSLKDEKNFSKNKRNKDGLQNWCKQCNKEYQKQRHIIKNNDWKLYRLVIDSKKLNSDAQYEKLHYVGITKKELADRLNEHVSAIRTRKTSGSYYWIDKVFKDVDLENIDLKKYIRIELIREYPSNLSKTQIKKHEKREVFREGKKSWEDGLERYGTLTPLFDLINIEHFEGCKRCKKISEKYDIIK